ncbi:succinylglutamate desuccinylase/aspartoacylase family protein [Natrialba swarupiae]|uniref:succinylglutamate desuccinylase/aspartoacylase family protein n=1 Tax=Natrialba swarupiae TaxID=2448032 RepID=UPI0013909FBA|nr:succinylglutamate desuccinylase/aspartoacylase family protein [Natrialba swarupiae]
MSTINISQAQIPEGESEWVEIDVGVDSDLSTVTLHLYVINGEREGPTLWLQGGIHGNEQGGSLAVRDLALELDPSEISGAVIALPVSNPSGFANKRRGSQINHVGPRDVNSLFPGDPDGTFPERLADEIFSLIRSHADAVINAHSADGETIMHTEFAYVPMSDTTTDERTSKLGSASGITHLVELDTTEMSGWMTAELVERGIPSIIVESGSGTHVYEWAYETYRRSIQNVARHLDILDGKPEETDSSQTVYSDLVFLNAGEGGFVETFVRGGDEVESGESLAEITDLKGRQRELITSPCDGTVFAIRSFPTARPGDLVIEMAPAPTPTDDAE